MESSVIVAEQPLKVVQIDPFVEGTPYGMGTCRFFGKISNDDGTDRSPGIPPGVLPPFADNEYEEKVRQLVGNAGVVVYATCDHSGRMMEVSDSSCSFVLPDGIWLNDAGVSFDEMNQHRVITVQGDAITSPHFNHKKHLVARGRDCLTIGAVSCKRVGVMHGSITNLFGWKQKNFLGPLLDRFLELFDAKTTQIFIGPSIRACHYEWDMEDANNLYQQVRQLYPTIDLQEFVCKTPHLSIKHKCCIDMTWVTDEILKLHGYTQVWRSETCTYHDNQYHSQRRDSNYLTHRPGNLVVVSI